MRSLSLLLSFWLALAVGCDPVSRTEFRTKPIQTGSDSSPASVLSEVEKVAEQHGLAFVEEHGNTKIFSDFSENLGKNPKLWMSVTADRWLLSVKIREEYISQRTEKHKKLVDSLTRSLREGDYRISAIGHTDSPSTWRNLVGLGCLVCVPIFAFWGYCRMTDKREIP